MGARKVPLFSAIAFVALFITGAGLLGTPLPVTATPDETVAWLKAHQDVIPTAAMCTALAVIPFFVLTAWVRRALPDVHGYAFLPAAGAFGAQALVSTWFLLGAALHADTIDPQVARGLLDVGAFFGPVLTTTDVVMGGAVALAALSNGVLPRWLGWLSLVFAVEQLAEVATIGGRDGFAAPGGDWNNVLGASLFMIWALALGIVLGRKPAGA